MWGAVNRQTLTTTVRQKLTGSSCLRQFSMGQLEIPDPLSNDTAIAMSVMISTTQQSVVADALVNTRATWDLAVPYAQTTTHGVSPFDRQGEVHTIKAHYYQPYSIANCIRDTIQGKDDPRAVSFPVTAPIGYNPVDQPLPFEIDVFLIPNYLISSG